MSGCGIQWGIMYKMQLSKTASIQSQLSFCTYAQYKITKIKSAHCRQINVISSYTIIIII